MQWEIVIPNWQPIRTNELIGVHWGTTCSLKKCQHRLVSLYAYQADVVPAEGAHRKRRRVTLTITLGPGQRGGDPDGYWEVLLDSLVKCGALVDDTIQWVEQAPVTFPYPRGPQPETRILIEELEGYARPLSARKKRPRSKIVEMSVN